MYDSSTPPKRRRPFCDSFLKVCCRLYLHDAMKAAFAFSILLFLIATTFGLSSEEEDAKTAHIVFRYVESIAVAFFWFEYTVRFLGYRYLEREEEKRDATAKMNEEQKANSEARKRSKRTWVWIDFVLTFIVSFPASSIYPISTSFRRALSKVYRDGKFLYVIQALAVFKLYTVSPALRAAGRHLTSNPSKYLKETLRTLAAGLFILLSGCFVYEILLIYYLDDYINSSEIVDYRHLWTSLKMAFSTMVRVLTCDDWYSLYADISRVKEGAWEGVTCLLLVGWVWMGGLVFAYLGHAAMVQYLMGVQPASQVMRRQTRELDVLKQRRAALEADTESYCKAFKDLLVSMEEKEPDVSSIGEIRLEDRDRAGPEEIQQKLEDTVKKIEGMVDRQEQLYDMMDMCIHHLVHHKMSVPPDSHTEVDRNDNPANNGGEGTNQ